MRRQPGHSTLLAIAALAFTAVQPGYAQPTPSSAPPTQGSSTPAPAATHQGSALDTGVVQHKKLSESIDTAPLPPPPPGSKPPSPDPRDLEGIYVAEEGWEYHPQAPPAYTPKAQQEFDRLREMTKEGKPAGGFLTTCRPPAFDALHLGMDLYPAQIFQTPDQIVIINEEGRSRWVIHMDRGHPSHVLPSYFGDSVGHWEGDILVVDTIGVKAQPRPGPMISSQAHIVTRIHKTDGGRKLEMITTVTDPDIYTEPYVTRGISDWHPELQLLEVQCEENFQGARSGVAQ